MENAGAQEEDQNHQDAGVAYLKPNKFKNVFSKKEATHACIRKQLLMAIKRNEIMPFAVTWMDLEIIILNEVSQKEKDKYHMISLICGI